MNILYITNGFPEPNSISNGIFIYHRYKRLKAAGHNVVVCKLNHLRAHSHKDSYSLNFFNGSNDIVEVVNYYQIPKVNIFFSLVPQLTKIVKKYSIDIVHSHFATQSFAAYKLHKAIGIPYVITGHGSGITRLISQSRRYAKITTKAFNNADHVIYVSNNLQNNAHIQGLKNINESVIYNGVEFFDFNIDEKALNKKNKRVCYVGSLKDIKRSQYLPDIFEKINSINPDIIFSIIGDGKHRHLIEAKLENNKLMSKVSMFGNISQEEVFKQLQKSDLLILPSKNEGFGCVILEAMMCGCQVVVSGNGGMPEAVGDAGSIVSDSETWIEDFAKAVVEQLKNPIAVNRLVERAKSFNWDKSVEQEIEVYKGVLNG